MKAHFPEATDAWLLEKSPHSDVVVSSRARVARNLQGIPFSPRASKEQLAAVTDALERALGANGVFSDYLHYDLSALSKVDRRFLRESHLISAEMEKGREHREVYLSPDGRTSIMVNEEDHVRLQTVAAGLQLNEVHARIEVTEAALEKGLKFAYHPQFGYLTACPTNTGTGLRVSVMVHLVGLAMTNQIEDSLGSLGDLGLVVRGAYGEHSSNAGDLFQISNEVTLGKTEEQLIQSLEGVVHQIIGRETQARELLFRHAQARCEDQVQRALGLLAHARMIDSNEAVTLLSRVRLAIGGDFGLRMTHEELNRLLIEVQPAHLRRRRDEIVSSEDGDRARAAMLRDRFSSPGNASRN